MMEKSRKLHKAVPLIVLILFVPLRAMPQTATPFEESFLYTPLIGNPYYVVTSDGYRQYENMAEGIGPEIFAYLKLPANMTPDYFFSSGNWDEVLVSVSATITNLQSALKSGSPIFKYVLEGNDWFSTYALARMDFISVADQYIYDQYKANTLPEWFYDGNPDESTVQAYLDIAAAEANASWDSWYHEQTFSDAYGLITERQSVRAASVLTYAKNAILYPIPFNFNRFNELSGGVFEYYKTAIQLELASLSSGSTGIDINETDVGYWVRKNAELIDSGAFNSFFEIELFRYWFNLEFWFPDTWALFKWAESGRSALSLPQIIGNLSLSTEIASSALLPGKADPRVKPKEGDDSGDDLRSSGGSLITPGSPKADLALTFFSLYDNPGTMIRSGTGYEYSSPSGLLKIGADLLVRSIGFEHLDRYVSTSILSRLSVSPIQSGGHEGTGTLTLGASINEWMLHSNYLHWATSWTHQYASGKLYAAGGALLSGSYWSQYPQMEIQTSFAGRLGFSPTRYFGLNFDGIYTHSHGAIWRGRWNPYDGENLDHLNLGIGLDVYIGDVFGISLGLRKDFLLSPLRSWEFYLGGDLVF